MRYNPALDGLRVGAKVNNFSSLRLIFSAAVIFSHSSSILTGDASFEPHLGRVTLGEFAVDGFFLLSGYLIAKSFDRDNDLGGFFRKRVLRIYPAFIINSLLCLFVLAPLVTPHYQASLLWVPHLIFLGSPNATGAFGGMPIPALNGPAWTLAYEFRCYILVALVGATLGLRKARIAILVAAMALLALSATHMLPKSSGTTYVVLGSPPDIARLFGMFATGMSFYLWREIITYSHRIAVAAFVALAASFLAPSTINLALAACGGYLIFWAAFKIPEIGLSRFGNKTDLSFGVYLYAWPIQMCIAYALDRSIGPLALSCIALAGASCAAYLSWTLIEKPAMALTKARRLPVAVAAE